MTPQRSTLPTLGSLVAGLTVFAWVRWEQVADWSGQSLPAVVAPVAVTYLAAAALGLLLVRDGVTRWWWVPATLLVAVGCPVDYWVGSSVVSTRYGFLAGSVVDLLAVLLPGAVLWLGSARRRPAAIDGRLIPALFVTAIAAILAMRIGIDGPDLSLSVGVALVALGVFSQSSSWQRALAFVALAVALGAQIPSSLAASLDQGLVGPVAFVDAVIDLAVGVLAFSIAPLSSLSRRLFERPVPGVAVHAQN